MVVVVVVVVVAAVAVVIVDHTFGGLLFVQVWTFLTKAWPIIRRAAVELFNVLPWPFIHRFHALVVAPAWRVASPLFMPLATGAFAVAAMRGGQGLADLASVKGSLMLFFRIMCSVSALVSTAVLLVHAYHRIRRVEVGWVIGFGCCWFVRA